jgi:GoLoco motif
MLKIQMLEQIVTKENVVDDAKIDNERCKSLAAHSRTGSLASDCGSAKCMKCNQLMTSSINSTHLYSNEQFLSRLRAMTRKSSGSEDDDVDDVVEELSCLGRHTNGILEKPDALYAATQDLFELLERVQCSRFDDQRCALQVWL